MRKLLIAALLPLTLVGTKADALVRFELTGTYSIRPLEGDGGYYAGKAVLSGYCVFDCEISKLDGEGFSFETNDFDDWYGLTFTYSTVHPTALSDAIRSGYGEITRLVPGVEFGEYDFERAVFTKARVYDDGVDYSDEWHPNFRGVDLRYISAPEPSTWAMMIGGFLLAGATLRRPRYRIAFR